MNKTLTFQDYEQISTYLDSAVSPRELAKIEARLQNDPQFKQEMLEIEHAKRLLSAIPKKRAPKNFTLSPAMAPQAPQRFFLMPVLNFVAMAATVLLVVVFAGSQLLVPSASKMAAESAAPMLAADQSASKVVSPMITWGQPGGYGGGGAPNAVANGMGGGPSLTTSQTYATPTPEMPPVEAPLGITAVQPTADASGLILGLAPVNERGTEIITKSTAAPLRTPIPWTLIAEIGLGVLAVISAATAWFLHRRH
jgi:hypothetical protein